MIPRRRHRRLPTSVRGGTCVMTDRSRLVHGCASASPGMSGMAPCNGYDSAAKIAEEAPGPSAVEIRVTVSKTEVARGRPP